MILKIHNLNKLKKQFNLVSFCKQYCDYTDHGNYIYIKCPFHNDNNPSLEIHQHYAKCRAGCTNKNGNNFDAIDLVSEILGMNITDTVVYISNSVGENIVIESQPKIVNTTVEKNHLLHIWTIAKRNNHDAYNYLFNVRKIKQPKTLPTNLGYINKNELSHLQGVPSFLKEECFVAPAYDENLKIQGLYFRFINPINNEKHRNYGTCKLWVPEIDGQLIKPKKDTWYAEGVADTFLTMAIEENYNVAACFSCSNFPKESNIIVDSDDASQLAAANSNAIKIRVGNGPDHAESTEYQEIITIDFNVSKMVVAIIMYATDIKLIIRILPYIFILANTSYINFCASFALRGIHSFTCKDLLGIMKFMFNSSIQKKSPKDHEQFFDDIVNPVELFNKVFILEEEFKNYYKFFTEYPLDALAKIEAFCHVEQLSHVYNQKFLANNAIHFNIIEENPDARAAKENLKCGLKYCTKGDIHVLAGHTGKGKTSVAMKMVNNMMNNHPDLKICYISFELTKYELLVKITGEQKIYDKLSILEIIDYELTQKMQQYVHFILNKLYKQGFDVIFIDHIGFLTASDGTWLQTIMQQIKTICNATGLTVICLAQFTKGVDGKGYFAIADNIIGGSWLITIASTIWIIQEYERVNTPQKFKLYWHLTYAKCRTKGPTDPYPSPISISKFLNDS